MPCVVVAILMETLDEWVVSVNLKCSGVLQ